MPVYELLDGRLAPANQTLFQIEGLKERQDIQRMLREQIAVLGDDLLVLAEEYGGWVDSNRRIDLLCLDSEANLVVVELKRDDAGHMELQALRYAAMVARMTFAEAVAAHAEFRRHNGVDGDGAEAAILAFLRWEEATEESFAQSVRIVLASADFGKELTTAVLWLRDQGIDITCIRLSPCKLSDGRLLLDVQQIIPLPEAAAFQTQIGLKRQAERMDRIERHDLRYRFWELLLDRAKTRTSLHANLSPSKDTWKSAGIGKRGFQLNYGLRQHDCSVYLWIADNKAAYNALLSEREAIETQFGAAFIWFEADGQKGCSIAYNMEGGYRSPPEEFEQIQDRMIDAMIRLEEVLVPRVLAMK